MFAKVVDMYRICGRRCVMLGARLGSRRCVFWATVKKKPEDIDSEGKERPFKEIRKAPGVNILSLDMQTGAAVF